MKIPELKKMAMTADCISSCVEIAKKVRDYSADNDLKMRNVAVLSNFNIKGLADCVIAKSFAHDIYVRCYEGEYGQWRQEVIGERLFEFNPEVIFLILDLFNLDDNLFYSHHTLSFEDLKLTVRSRLEEVLKAVDLIKQKTKAKIVISNFPSHWNKILGIIDYKVKNSLRRSIIESNLFLEEKYFADQQIFVFDFDGWLGYLGKEKYWNDKFFYLADMHLSPTVIPFLAEELLAYLIPLSSKSKKCLVLDLDNTLWGGIVGEDGISGIELSPEGKGKPFYLFQKLILGYYNRGIILAINSKNNLQDINLIFNSHPHMILKEKHFAAMRINWQDKVTNLIELSKELNIGLDSMVFVDDDASNRLAVKSFLPEVHVLDLPNNPEEYFRTLLTFKGFNYLEFTKEDEKRGETYFAERERNKLRAEAVDMDSFLKSLNLQIIIEPISSFSLSRAAQLTQKTNQFNFTTFRYQEEDIKEMIGRGDMIWTLRVMDAFGDYGLTGLLIIKKNKQFWEIDTFLLSCRVLGKRIEEQFLGYVLNELKKKDGKNLVGRYIMTEKNQQVKNFYSKFGFKEKVLSDNESLWELDLKQYCFEPIEFIKIINDSTF